MSSQKPKVHEDKSKLLLAAAKDGDMLKATTLLSSTNHVDVNAEDPYGNTPLMIAADRGYMEIAEELIAHEAKVNAVDKYGQSALMYAAFSGHFNLAKLLLEHRAKVNHASLYGQTALMKAAYGNSLPIITLLLNHKASMEARSLEGRTALMIAADANHLTIVQFLLEHPTTKAQINATDNDGHSAIMLAARKSHFLVVEYLAGAGADLEIHNKYGQTIYEVPPADGNIRQAEHRENIDAAVKRGLQAALDTKIRLENALKRSPTSESTFSENSVVLTPPQKTLYQTKPAASSAAAESEEKKQPSKLWK